MDEPEIVKYSERFDLPRSAELFLSNQRAIWNPPRGAVAIYRTMLTSGVTLPLQPFIARFLADTGIAPAQLSPNSYRVLISLWHLWKKISAKYPPTPQEIRNFYTVGRSDNGVYEIDIVAGDQAEKIKNVDKVSHAEAAAQLAQGIAPPKQTMVEHIYDSDPNASSDVPDREREVIKTATDSSAPDVIRGKKKLKSASESGAHQTGFKAVIFEEDEKDHDTLTDLIRKEHRSKRGNDQAPTTSTLLSSNRSGSNDPAATGAVRQITSLKVQPPRPSEPTPLQAGHPISQVSSDLPVHLAGKAPIQFSIKRQIVFTDSDSDEGQASPEKISTDPLAPENNLSDHEAEHIDKTSFRLGRPSGPLPSIVLTPIISIVEAGPSGTADQEQVQATPEAIPTSHSELMDQPPLAPGIIIPPS
ncbi:hypothetical protein Dsin_017117 [Dipteronia sinensis]|uniref:Uncharacterized protein n=1 Tax=Dipteronia sinensis TaxID=43782 RepID=A0AAE0AEE7_9ROSI|nr:hypothetical protein Dsin_017117 [Dipteronia sinensis]